MSYPSPTYLGSTGEVTAQFRPVDTPPELLRPGGGAAGYLATGASTGGRFGLYRWDMGTQPGGAEPHFHRTITESFFVLSGTVSIYDGNEWVPATAGDFTFVPEGGLHGFRNDSGEPASMLILFVPGAPREDYFETLARVAEGLVLTHDQKTEFFLRHDTYWL